MCYSTLSPANSNSFPEQCEQTPANFSPTHKYERRKLRVEADESEKTDEAVGGAGDNGEMSTIINDIIITEAPSYVHAFIELLISPEPRQIPIIIVS